MKKIIMKLKPNGETEIQVEGSQGATCKELTKALEKALGKVITDNETEEMFFTQELTNIETNE